MPKKITKWQPDDFEFEMTTTGHSPSEAIGLPTMQNGEETEHRIFRETSCFVILRMKI